MNLIALEIPEDPALLPGWLEEHLVSTDLAALVAELEAVHGQHGGEPVPSLDQVLHGQRDALLARGLKTLPGDRLRALLCRPRLLLDLQELLLASGGPHWLDRAARAVEHAQAVERGWGRLKASLRDQPVSGGTLPPSRLASEIQRPPRTSLLRWAATLATAAAVLLGVFLVEQARVARQAQSALIASRWGWNRPGALPQDLGPGAYLNRIADAAAEWFNQRPEGPIDLARRLGELRQGCSVLILSPHKPLSAQDRTWLVEKCRAWAAKLDAHLVSLEGGAAAAKGADEADATVDKLIKALRERASALASSKAIS